MKNQVIEQNIIFDQKLIKEAFDYSAKAFSIFINKEVKIEVVRNEHQNQIEENSEEVNFVLLSELKGDLKGKCYLNFTPKDAKKLFSHCLSAQYQNEPEMQDAILLELDNILTAAVITIFSNKLKLNTHAYVPNLLKIKNSDLDKLIEKDLENNNLIYYFYTKFKIEETSLSADFIWVLDTTDLLNKLQ